MSTGAADVLVLVPWLSSGLAAVVTAPRNLAARALLTAAVAGGAAGTLADVADDQRSGVASAVLPTLTSITYLLAITAMCTILVTYPGGEGTYERLEHRPSRRLLALFTALAVLAPLAALVGAPRFDVLGRDGTGRTNVAAVGGLRLVGETGHLIAGADPVWLLAALAVLALRWRSADAEQRRELRPLTYGIAALAMLLVLVVLASATGVQPPEPTFEVVFRVGLALLPVALLTGLSHRTRRMEGELSASRSRLITAEDRVRRSIERDLHDGVQQQLVAILSLTQLATRQVRRDPEVVVATLGDVREQITTAIGDLRELVYGIRPPVLQDAGVVAALESRLERLGPAVTLQDSGVGARRWAPEIEAAAYFVVCEAVANAMKHAAGSPVVVRLATLDGDLSVSVEDRGPGIADRSRGGSGLAGLADRVSSLGGSFTVERRDGGGTEVRAVLPAAVTT